MGFSRIFHGSSRSWSFYGRENFWKNRDLNHWPLEWQSSVLTTRPCHSPTNINLLKFYWNCEVQEFGKHSASPLFLSIELHLGSFYWSFCIWELFSFFCFCFILPWTISLTLAFAFALFVALNNYFLFLNLAFAFALHCSEQSFSFSCYLFHKMNNSYCH